MKLEIAMLMVTLVAACVVIHEQRLKQVEKDVEWLNAEMGKKVSENITNG